MSGKLVQWLVVLPPAAHSEIQTALIEADIARIAGRKDWRCVFEFYQNKSTGKLKKIYAALRKQKNEKAMEVFWAALKAKRELRDVRFNSH
jgi:hypothetical protein